MGKKKLILVSAIIIFVVGAIAVAFEGANHFDHKPTSNVRSIDVDAHPKSICTVKVVTDDFEIIEFPELGVTCFNEEYISSPGAGVGVSCVDGRRLTEKMGDKLGLPETYCE